jgi:hypothetical protein
MARSRASHTYAGYSAGCAIVWAVILALSRRMPDDTARARLQIVCGGWWSGWLSATIARAGYPPPKPLSPAGAERLKWISLVLVAVGLAGAANALRGGRAGHAGGS